MSFIFLNIYAITFVIYVKEIFLGPAGVYDYGEEERWRDWVSDDEKGVVQKM